MLNLRQIIHHPSEHATTVPSRLSVIQFGPPAGFVGNMGESLQFGEEEEDRELEDGVEMATLHPDA